MPDQDPSTATASFFPDIPSITPQEVDQAQKRSASLGLLSAGLAILSQPHRHRESAVIPIARGASVGLDEYQNSLAETAKAMMDRQKLAIDSYKDKIAEQRAESYAQHQQIIEEQGLERDKLLGESDAEKARHDTASEASTETYRSIEQQNADTSARRADTQAAAEARRDDPVGANSPLVGKFDRYRSIPGMEKYMSVAYPPDTLAGMTQADLKKADDNIRKEYLNVQKGKTTYFTQPDGMRHMVTTDAAGDTKDQILGPVLTPGTDKDAKTKDFTQYRVGPDGAREPWTVTRNMSLPGAPAINVQPLKGHHYGWIYKDPDSIPSAQDFNALDPSVTGRIGSRPGTGTAGATVVPTGTVIGGPRAGQVLTGKFANAHVEWNPTTNKYKVTGGGAGGGSGAGGGGGAGASAAPRAPAAPGGLPKLYTEGGIHRNSKTGEYLVVMPDGKFGWAKTPNGAGARHAEATGGA